MITDSPAARQVLLEILHRLLKSTDESANTLSNMTTTPAVDALDARLIALLHAEPRIGVLECARRLSVARGTVQARLDKLLARASSRTSVPVSTRGVGYSVMAFMTLEIAQVHGHRPVAAHLARIPEVLEAHTVTGSGDLVCRIVARTNSDLQRVIDQIVSFEGVVRGSSVIALAEQVPYRTMPLVAAAVAEPSRISQT